MRNTVRVLICLWIAGAPTTLAADKADKADKSDKAQAHKETGSQENAPALPTNAPAASTKGKRTKPLRSARRAVHEGNLLLQAGDAAGALKDYDDATRLEPDAPEIPFVRGLSYFGLGKYDEAREAFRKAAAAKNRQLAGDALYSLGTTYHAKALSHLDKPDEAIKELEQAMQRYRTVLADHPNHRAARDADFKAASLRRRLVKKLEKQKQQQQKQDSSKDKQKNEDEKNQSPPKDPKNTSEKQNEKQSQKQQKNKSEQQKKNDKKQSSDQQNQTPNDKEQPSSTAQQKQAEKENERNSRQQARRRLREMMQAQRDRKKHRSQPRRRVAVRPVDKDW